MAEIITHTLIQPIADNTLLVQLGFEGNILVTLVVFLQ